MKEGAHLDYFGDPDSVGAKSYLITMEANDGHPPRSARPQLKVRVTVANVDEPPSITTSSCSVSEAAEPGTPICSLDVRVYRREREPRTSGKAKRAKALAEHLECSR